MAQFKNYINGEWVESAQVNRNVNPSDLSDVVGEFARGRPRARRSRRSRRRAPRSRSGR